MVWICCQLGQREHYLVPRALRENAETVALVTDVWWPGLKGRFHPQIKDIRLEPSTVRFLGFEAAQRGMGRSGWNLAIRRNDRFGLFAAEALGRLRKDFASSGEVFVFSYSYTALRPFRWAKQWGWRCVLGQIDCGRAYEWRRQAAAQRYAWLSENATSPPARYWTDWADECSLADAIVVNSQWAKSCLLEAGISESKVSVVPLPHPVPVEDKSAARSYPDNFTASRPMRVLYLSQVTTMKGIGALLEATAILAGAPVEFWIAGPSQMKLPASYLSARNIRWFGRVGSKQKRDLYRTADVFVFPSLCDGFGLVQLEAQRERLPLIASPFCGDVVEDGVNGVRLEEVSGETIATALQDLLASPGQLAAFSANALRRDRQIAEYGRAIISASQHA